MAVNRIIRRKNNTYNTRSNKTVVIKTETGRHIMRILKKTGAVAKCGNCPRKLNGLKKSRPAAYARLKKSQRTVSRVDGGILCQTCSTRKIINSI